MHFCFDFWGGLYCFNLLSFTLYWGGGVSVFIIIILFFYVIYITFRPGAPIHIAKYGPDWLT